MRSPLARALREAVAARLPEGAFLRRDRGEALFVTDAPRRRPDADWSAALAGAGFACAEEAGLLRISPDAPWLARLEAAYPEPPDPFCASLRRFAGLPPEAESLRLFALGARALDGGEDGARFERLLRQRTAVCLRENRIHPRSSPRGGGLYACALLTHILKEGNEHEVEMAGTRLL